MAVVLSLVQTKQIIINIHKRDNTKTESIQVHTLPNHLHKCHNTITYTHPHITKQVKTTTVKDTQLMK